MRPHYSCFLIHACFLRFHLSPAKGSLSAWSTLPQPSTWEKLHEYVLNNHMKGQETSECSAHSLPHPALLALNKGLHRSTNCICGTQDPGITKI